MTNKKYKIIKSIEDDAPSGDINWCTISFLTPQKNDATKYLDVKAFKVYNGYNVAELAHSDAQKIKKINKNHDVFISQLGKLYEWDNATKCDSVEYDDKKLNDLEKTRRENIDKIKLMSEEVKNEHKTIYENVNSVRINTQKKRIQKKLYDKGLITKREYDIIHEENKTVNEIKEMAVQLDKMNKEIELCYQTDYLDVDDPTGLKYGCASIFMPNHIKGLKILCFKIRGLFQTTAELDKRIKKLRNITPYDRIYTFEVGKWSAFSEKDDVPHTVLLKQLNYYMKCYLDNIEHEKEEFDKRKESLQARTEEESKIIKAKNRQEKRKEKRKEKRSQKNPPDTSTKTSATTNSAPSLGNVDDDIAIQKILNYIDEPGLKNKFAADKTTLQTMETVLN